MVETEEQDKVLKMIEDELKDLSISDSDLARRKKVMKSGSIYSSDNINALNSKVLYDIFDYDKVILDEYKKIDSITIKKYNSIMSKISLDNKTVYYVNKS